MLTIAEIKERWGRATKGPWLWAGSNNSVALMAARGWGDVVMAFRRWGMRGAQPAFVIDGLIYDVARGKGGRSLLIRPESHNQWKIRGIDHPDAVAIANAPTDVAFLLGEVERLQQIEAAAEAFYAAYGEAWIPAAHHARVALFDLLDAQRPPGGE